MNQCLLQNVQESILRDHVHLPYGMNVDLTNSWSSSCELSSLTCHSGCCFLFSLLLQAALRWPSCLTTVVTNGFSMATLVEWCVLFSQRWQMMICLSAASWSLCSVDFSLGLGFSHLAASLGSAHFVQPLNTAV